MSEGQQDRSPGRRRSDKIKGVGAVGGYLTGIASSGVLFVIAQQLGAIDVRLDHMEGKKCPDVEVTCECRDPGG